MFKPNTVFVLGAGASYEVGFPLGADLMKDIRKILAYEYDSLGAIKGGHVEFLAILEFYAGNTCIPLNEVIDASRRLSRALISATSIDDALNTFSDDSIVTDIGKLAICFLLLRKEASSNVFHDPTISRLLQLDKVSNSWYHQFCRILFESVQRRSRRDLFKDIKVVNFNYDRSLKYFLRHAISQRFSIPLGESEEIVESLEILLPYGNLGPLAGPNRTEYGSPAVPEAVIRIAPGIRTLHEQTSNLDEIAKVRKTIASSDTLIFLGFGFLQQNMRLIQPVDLDINVSRVFGTAKEMSSPNVNSATLLLKEYFAKLHNRQRSSELLISLNCDMTCHKLLGDHHFPLSI